MTEAQTFQGGCMSSLTAMGPQGLERIEDQPKPVWQTQAFREILQQGTDFPLIITAIITRVIELYIFKMSTAVLPRTRGGTQLLSPIFR